MISVVTLLIKKCFHTQTELNTPQNRDTDYCDKTLAERFLHNMGSFSYSC